MTDAEKLKMVKAMTGETDEDTLSTYLSIAGNKVCRKAYPFDPTVTAGHCSLCRCDGRLSA